MLTSALLVPQGRFHANTDDDAAARERKRIAEMLRKGQTVSVNSSGTLHEPGRTVEGTVVSSSSQNVVEGEVELVVPTGKLA